MSSAGGLNSGRDKLGGAKTYATRSSLVFGGDKYIIMCAPDCFVSFVYLPAWDLGFKTVEKITLLAKKSILFPFIRRFRYWTVSRPYLNRKCVLSTTTAKTYNIQRE